MQGAKSNGAMCLTNTVESVEDAMDSIMQLFCSVSIFVMQDSFILCLLALVKYSCNMKAKRINLTFALILSSSDALMTSTSPPTLLALAA